MQGRGGGGIFIQKQTFQEMVLVYIFIILQAKYVIEKFTISGEVQVVRSDWLLKKNTRCVWPDAKEAKYSSLAKYLRDTTPKATWAHYDVEVIQNGGKFYL